MYHCNVSFIVEGYAIKNLRMYISNSIIGLKRLGGHEFDASSIDFPIRQKKIESHQDWEVYTPSDAGDRLTGKIDRCTDDRCSLKLEAGGKLDIEDKSISRLDMKVDLAIIGDIVHLMINTQDICIMNYKRVEDYLDVMQ